MATTRCVRIGFVGGIKISLLVAAAFLAIVGIGLYQRYLWFIYESPEYVSVDGTSRTITPLGSVPLWKAPGSAVERNSTGNNNEQRELLAGLSAADSVISYRL